MTARDDILSAINSFEKRTGSDTFSVGEVLDELRHLGIPHNESTIRTHVVSHMCVNAPQHTSIPHPDLFRVSRGLYRRARPGDAAASAEIPLGSGNTSPDRKQRLADRATSLISGFTDSVAAFSRARPFTGPSLYFHERTCRLVLGHSRPSLAIADDAVVEGIYATLTAWGMHRMGPKGAKLPSFDQFSGGLHRVAGRFDELADLHLGTVGPGEVGGVADELWSSIEQLDVSTTSARLVAGTKTIHHLLPNLVPPIDRQYTGQFFYGSSGKSWYMGEATAFRELFPALARVAREASSEIETELSRAGAYMATSYTKIIDNGIVGTVIRERQ